MNINTNLNWYTVTGIWDFDYTGTIQSINLSSGRYKLEVWGAVGGCWGGGGGSAGGYSVGTIFLNHSHSVFIGVGGAGVKTGSYCYGGSGYNGGGICSSRGVTGGGATHIASADGLLSSLVTNQESIFIVAGGGGSNGGNGRSDGYGGGLTGGNTQNGDVIFETGGTQSHGGFVGNLGTFGQGGKTFGGGAGGGGFYGGAGSGVSGTLNAISGGGGSGYLGGVETFGEILVSSIPGNQQMPTPDGGIRTGWNRNGYARITKIS